jgi:3D (Asp-Asp-Asp) domain-containing protein
VSTNWRRGRLFFWRAYVASGPNTGKRKYVGITSSGTKASKGTIAADTRYYPYGTVMKIPGYGKGVVEDTGSAIKKRPASAAWQRNKHYERLAY